MTTTAATKTIYCFAQQCVCAGMVVPTTQHACYCAGHEDQSEDIFAAYAGTEDEIRHEATCDAANCKGFNAKVARNVLAYLG